VTFHEARRNFERQYLTELLKSVRGNMMKAALIADYDRPHFYALVRRNGIDHREFKKR
jgi:two-component system, NtrC family, response regulator GlrR